MCKHAPVCLSSVRVYVCFRLHVWMFLCPYMLVFSSVCVCMCVEGMNVSVCMCMCVSMLVCVYVVVIVCLYMLI